MNETDSLIARFFQGIKSFTMSAIDIPLRKDTP